MARFGHRTPVSHSPARRAVPFPTVGGACGGCIIGKVGNPEIEEPEAIQRIVDLLAADPSLKFCRAVRKIAAETRGNEQEKKKRYERLRKKYHRLKKLGELPDAASPLERKAAAVAEHYARRRAAIEAARVDLAAAEHMRSPSV